MTHDLQLWCEDCQKSYNGECEEHGPLTHVSDTEIGTRARRSLPHLLQLKEDRNHIGVFAKETLAKRLQFGPLQGISEKEPSKFIKAEEEIKNRYGIVYKLVQENEDLFLLDTRLEEHSNWMIFVRPAEKKAEQNLVAFQYKGGIFFATIKEVPAQSELKVWFSKDYAERMGTKILSDDSSSWQFRTRQKFNCLGCELVFSSAASLTNHRCSKSKQSTKSEGFPSRKRTKKRSSLAVINPKSQVTTSSATPSSSSEPSTSVKSVLKSSFQGETSGLEKKSRTVVVSDSSDSSEDDLTEEPKASSTLSSKSYQCTECQKVFNSPGKLKQHSYAHTGERPFSCPHCQKAFSSRFKLGRHQLIHTGVRQHQCHLCNRSFHRKDHLKNHIQIHDPNKQFKCKRTDCAKEYNSYMSYRKHCAHHAAEEGDLECKICSEMFDNKNDLIYHLKVHVGTRTVKSPSEKKFQCDFCERRFFTRKDVKRHLVVHTGKRDFVCSICPQKFGRKDHLVRHVKKSHGVTDPKATDPLSTPGPSTSSRALSPEAAALSSASASSGDQSFTSMLMGESLPGPSSEPSKLFSDTSPLQPSTETYESTAFPSDLEFFEEGIKEEPDLTASIIDPGGDDLSKILGMYLPTESMHLPVSSLLEGEPLPSTLMSSSFDEGDGSQMLPVEGSSSSSMYQLPQESLIRTTEEQGTPQVSSTETSATQTSTSSTTSLPGFHQAFP